MERPSDIHGLIYISFNNGVDEVTQTLAQEMCSQGIQIPVQRL